MSMNTAYTEREQGSSIADFLSEYAQVLSIAVFFTACLAFFSFSTTTFLTVPNLLNVVRQAAPILVVATAMTLVIITAGIDLSVGSLVALINAVAAITIAAGYPWPLVVMAMLLLGGLVGLAQGWFTAYQGIPAFIVTLAGLSILRGIALYLTQGYSIPIKDVPGFLYLGRGELLGIPVPAIIAILIVILGYVVLSQTRYGRRVVAVGIQSGSCSSGRYACKRHHSFCLYGIGRCRSHCRTIVCSKAGFWFIQCSGGL